MGYGTLPNPWPKFKVTDVESGFDYDNGTKWKSLWNVDSENCDPVQIAADFYLLQAISSGFLAVGKEPPFVDFTEEEIREAASRLGITSDAKITKRIKDGKQKEKDTVDPLYEFESRAAEMVNDLTNRHLDTFQNYLELSCGGELRHHKGFNNGKTTSGNRRAAWAAWYYIRQHFGLEALEIAVKYFEDFGGGGYGGPKWATNPQLLLDFYKGNLGKDEDSNRRMFMDRVFTLVHNNGCMLNKLGWANYRGERVVPGDDDYDNESPAMYFGLEDGMSRVLEAHSSDEPDLKVLAAFSSNDVFELYEKYSKALG